jgi:hypothetical protein
MKLPYFLAIIVLGASAFNLHSQGYIVSDGIGIQDPNMVTVIQNPTTGDYTGGFIVNKGSSSFGFQTLVDEGVRAFIVNDGDPISLQPIVNISYPEFTAASSVMLSEAMPFYLGFYTGYMPEMGIYKDPVFGWGEFVNLNGTITLLDSALEYGGGGIIAGTQTILPVPEPGTLGLIALGGLLLAWRCKALSEFSKTGD